MNFQEAAVAALLSPYLSYVYSRMDKYNENRIIYRYADYVRPPCFSANKILPTCDVAG